MLYVLPSENWEENVDGVKNGRKKTSSKKKITKNKWERNICTEDPIDYSFNFKYLNNKFNHKNGK